MKQLTEYTKNGHHFTLCIRSCDMGIFHGKRIGGKSETWEAIKIQSHNGREIAGTYCEPAEYPPSNEQWGSKGWTCDSLESAKNRIDRESAKALEVAG